jgi:hypothetical protein
MLGAVVLGTHVYAQSAENKSRRAAALSRICEHIFNAYVRDVGFAENHQFKVSFLVPRPCRKEWHDVRKKEERLYVRGRHQTKTGKSTSMVSFGHNEGCAGRAYAENKPIVMRLDRAYDPHNPEVYYRECEEKWGLPREKVEQLNEKVAYVLSIPISYHGTDRVVGVVSIDCMVPIMIPEKTVLKVKSGVLHYSALFKNKDQWTASRQLKRLFKSGSMNPSSGSLASILTMPAFRSYLMRMTFLA